MALPTRGFVAASEFMKPCDPVTFNGPDNTEALTAFFNAVKTNERSGVSLYFDGCYKINGPVPIQRPCVSLVGEGPEVSSIIGQRYRPTFVCHQGVTDQIPAFARPDAYSVLDSTIAVAPGVWRGFSTFGTYSAIGVGNCTSLGGWKGELADYHATWSGITIELAVSTPDGKALRPGSPICGFGSSLENNGPWLIDFVEGGYVRFVLWLDGPSPGQSKFIVLNAPWAENELNRIRFAVDFKTGLTEVRNSANYKSTGFQDLEKFTIAHSGDDNPFCIGRVGLEIEPQSSASSLTIFGLRVCNRFEEYNPADTRYQGFWDDNTVWYYNGNAPNFTQPWLEIQGGPAAEHQATVMPIIQRDGLIPGSYKGLAVRGINFSFGGPALLMGAPLNVQIRECMFLGGTQSIGMLRTNAVYPVTISDSYLEGRDSVISANRSTITLRDTHINSFGGPYGIKALQTNITWRGGMVMYPSADFRSLVRIRRGEYGLHAHVSDVQVDNEDGAAKLNGPMFHIESAVDNPTSVSIERNYSVDSGPKACVFKVDAPPKVQPGFKPPYISAKGNTCYGSMFAFGIINGYWQGDIDPRGSSSTTVISDGWDVIAGTQTLDGNRHQPDG